MNAEAGDARVLVTGAAGFGGSGLVKALLARGHAVTGLDIVAPLHADALRSEMSHPAFRYVWKSIQDIRPEDVSGHSTVVHMAAQADVPLGFDSPRYTFMQNVDGTISVLEAVRHAGCVSRLVYAGSGNEVGRAPVSSNRRGPSPDAPQSLLILEGGRRDGGVGVAPRLWHTSHRHE